MPSYRMDIAHPVTYAFNACCASSNWLVVSMAMRNKQLQITSTPQCELLHIQSTLGNCCNFLILYWQTNDWRWQTCLQFHSLSPKFRHSTIPLKIMLFDIGKLHNPSLRKIYLEIVKTPSPWLLVQTLRPPDPATISRSFFLILIRRCVNAVDVTLSHDTLTRKVTNSNLKKQRAA